MKRFALLLFLALPLLVAAQDSARKLPSIGADELRARRAALMDRLKDGILLIEADPLFKGEDGIDGNTPLYDYAYLAGYHKAGDFLVLVPATKTAILFSEAVEGLKEKTGATEIIAPDRFEEFVRDVASASKTIYTRLRRNAKAFVTAHCKDADVRSTAIAGELVRMRLIKSAGEMEMMRKSTDSGVKGHIAAMKAMKPGMNEGDIQKVYETAFKAEGCDGLAYPCIVGSGENGLVLHYMKNDKVMAADTLVVCDCGPSYKGYATDITRTLPTSGKFTERQRTCYQAVLDAQKAAEKILKPGVNFRDLEKAAQAVFEDRDLHDWSYSHSTGGGPRHGLGHYVGLSVHDSGTYREKFAAGMVITIEPGYYSKADGWGIRIEDMYLVTEDGFTRLTSALPREVDEVEKMMKK